MARRIAALAGLVVLAAVMALAFLGVPPSGTGRSAVAEEVLERVVDERHATEAVGAVTFDYRGIDTLAEEHILFAAVIGAATLLRRHRDERDSARDEDDRARDRTLFRPSEAVRTAAPFVVLAMIVLGGYMVTHGQVSPGGGFQGGVVLASAPLVVYLATNARTFRRIAPEGIVSVAETVGVAGYVAIGAVGLVRSAPFLANVLPLGSAGEVLSAGTIFALNVSVGLAVAGGLVVLTLAFLRDAIARRMTGEAK